MDRNLMRDLLCSCESNTVQVAGDGGDQTTKKEGFLIEVTKNILE